MTRKSAVTVAALLVAIVLVVPLVTMKLFKDGLYYPHLVINASDSVDTEFLLSGRRSEANCERVLVNMVQAIKTVCPTCAVKAQRCDNSLGPAKRRVLSAEPLEIPSSRVSDGVVTYRSVNAHLAQLACKESENQSAKYPDARLKCYAAGAARSYTVPTASIERRAYVAAAWFAAVSAVVCWLTCLLLVKFQRLHAHVSLDGTHGGPQKFHAVATPRIGGLALLIGLLFTGVGLVPVEQRFSVEEYGYLILAALPAFAAGFAEDITKKVGVLTRLLATMAAAALCAWFLSAILRRLDVPALDAMLVWTPLAIAFTVFAVGGVANAINIIDGYNGLVGGYAIIVLAAIAWVASQVGDMFILTAALSMGGALLGFLAWNFPNGRIFLGDGGAYCLGFWLAELSVLLVARHETVSPWFPLVLLLYPVFETLFSIYRRIVHRRGHPGHPDALHFHQLIYMRLARFAVGSRDGRLITARNSAVARYVWVANGIVVVSAVALWNNTTALVIIAISFCYTYVWLYRRLVKWRAPRWLIASSWI